MTTPCEHCGEAARLTRRTLQQMLVTIDGRQEWRDVEEPTLHFECTSCGRTFSKVSLPTVGGLTVQELREHRPGERWR